MVQELLLIPGPTNLSVRVLNALNQPQVSHMSPEFYEYFGECLQLIKYVFRTQKGHPYLLTGSGSLGMEAAVVSLIEPKDKVLILNTGDFGYRFAIICEAHEANVQIENFEFGKHANVDRVKEILSKDNFKAVFMTHVETSATVMNPIRELTKLAKRYGALSIVDSICGVGGEELNFDSEGYDVVITCSQKCLAAPPGLTILCLSDRAIEAMQNRKVPIRSYYANLLRWKKVMDDPTYYLATPAVNLVLALREALLEIKEEGIERRWARHKLIGEAFRAGLETMKVEFIAEENYRADTVTGFYTRDEKAPEIQAMLRKRFRIHIAKGLYENKNKILRIGHFGNLWSKDIAATLSALEITLKAFGRDIKLGEANKVAQPYLEKLSTIEPQNIA